MSNFGIKFLEEPKINLYNLEEFEKGFFEIQDEGSQFICDKIDIQEKDKILDFCAGSGGKSLAIAHKLKNTGQIYLHDIREKALLNAKKRFKRSGFTNVQFHNNLDSLSKLENKFDWLILDVPCTGSGTLRRNPDLKYKINNDQLKYQTELQISIFRNSLRFLKPNGKLIYITCSILDLENNVIVKKMLKEKKSLKLIEEKNLEIKDNGNDGFYYAILEKNN